MNFLKFLYCKFYLFKKPTKISLPQYVYIKNEKRKNPLFLNQYRIFSFLSSFSLNIRFLAINLTLVIFTYMVSVKLITDLWILFLASLSIFIVGLINFLISAYSWVQYKKQNDVYIRNLDNAIESSYTYDEFYEKMNFYYL